MTRDVVEVMQDALAMPLEARTTLAGSLLDSLETEIDPGVEAAWRDEIQRRSAELDSGAVAAVPWREIEEQMQSALKPAR